LYRQGVDARADDALNMVGEAEELFAQAVEADPGHAEAWAALALARAGQVAWEQGEAQQALAARARAAANRALQIDGNSVEAQAALALVPSQFGRWSEAQDEVRRLLAAPGKTRYVEWLLHFRLSELLAEVGRCRDALAEFRAAVAIAPRHPWSSVGLAQALWMAGEPEAARAQSERAIRRFPRRGMSWFMHMALLTYGSRPEDAVAFAGDRAQLPHRESGEGLLFRRVITAKALAELKPEDIAHAVRLHRASVAADREETHAAARFFTALGDLDTVFELLRGYYLNAGGFADPSRPPPNPLTHFAMMDLFWPPMAPAWRDPRFASLAEEIGLGDYWRDTRIEPDFRRRRPS
jgi:Tfp pilus assembly protein PilF